MTYLRALFLLLTLGSTLACGEITAQRWEETAAAAARHALEPELLASLVWQESRYCADAVSPAGAIGLGQLMPATALELGVDPWQPLENLEGAARYLRAQLDTFGNLEHALAAYNAGPNAVRRYGGVPPYAETQAYVPAVIAFYTDFIGQREGTVTSVASVENDVAEAAPLEDTAERAALTQPLTLYRRDTAQGAQSGSDLLLFSGDAAQPLDVATDDQTGGGGSLTLFRRPASEDSGESE